MAHDMQIMQIINSKYYLISAMFSGFYATGKNEPLIRFSDRNVPCFDNKSH